MGMPEPGAGDPRWSLDLAGGALMDLGCYGLHIMRRFGQPSVVSATAVQRTPGIDESCDVEMVFPSGLTGLSTNTMVGDRYSFTLRIAGTRGEAFVHNFIKPQDDDRLTLTTDGGTTVKHHETRATYTYQLEAFADHVLHGKPVPLDTADAVANMSLIDDAYRAAGMQPR